MTNLTDVFKTKKVGTESVPNMIFEIKYANQALIDYLDPGNVTIDLIKMTETKLVFKFNFPDPSIIPSSSFDLDKVELYIMNPTLLECKNGRLFDELEVPMVTMIPPLFSEKDLVFSQAAGQSAKDASYVAIFALALGIVFGVFMQALFEKIRSISFMTFQIGISIIFPAVV